MDKQTRSRFMSPVSIFFNGLAGDECQYCGFGKEGRRPKLCVRHLDRQWIVDLLNEDNSRYCGVGRRSGLYDHARWVNEDGEWVVYLNPYRSNFNEDNMKQFLADCKRYNMLIIPKNESKYHPNAVEIKVFHLKPV